MASNVLVCDNGTGFVKVGHARSNLPQSVFPAIVGRPQLRAEMESLEQHQLKDIMVGDEAEKVRFALKLNYPVENGIVKHWNDMEELWNYTFHEKMRINPEEYKIMLTEAPGNPTNNRVKTLETMFEKYQFKAVHVGIQAMLVLYAQGLLTGVVVDSGDGVTHAVGVYEGFVPETLISRLNVAGRHITQYLIKLMLLRGYSFNSSADFDEVRRLKEKLCYVAYDLKEETRLADDTTAVMANYTLPDKTVIKIGRERFLAPEALFDPSRVNVSTDGLSMMLFNMFKKADIDVRSKLFQHVVLSGGTSMYPGLPSRLEKDLKHLYITKFLRLDETRAGRGGNELKKFKLRIEAPPRRKNMVFLGASVLAEIMAEREEFWISKSSWDEGDRANILTRLAGGIR
eukprot:maker-scaffold_23-snap-gene-4.57-mRNA-1 protein AED:0.02 eAED:0.02 QI:204/1/1/1/1/1/3/111/399